MAKKKNEAIRQKDVKKTNRTIALYSSGAAFQLGVNYANES